MSRFYTVHSLKLHYDSRYDFDSLGNVVPAYSKTLYYCGPSFIKAVIVLVRLRVKGHKHIVVRND